MTLVEWSIVMAIKVFGILCGVLALGVCAAYAVWYLSANETNDVK